MTKISEAPQTTPSTYGNESASSLTHHMFISEKALYKTIEERMGNKERHLQLGHIGSEKSPTWKRKRGEK